MFDAALRPYLDKIVDPIGRMFAARGISASTVTVVGFACAHDRRYCCCNGDDAGGVCVYLLNRFVMGWMGRLLGQRLLRISVDFWILCLILFSTQ